MVQMRYLLMVIAITIICSCKGQPDKADKKISNTPKQSAEAVDFKDMLSLTRSEAIVKYGSPQTEEQFVLNDLLGEFRIGLKNVFSEQERLSESISIIESTWEKDSTSWFTVWYQKTELKEIARDTLSWVKGSEF